MADVTLVLKADNSGYINKIKEAQKESQKLHDTEEKSSKNRLGFMEAEIRMQDQIREKRQKATNIENIKIYNNLLADSKKRLEELEKAGVDSNEKLSKSSDNLIGKLGKMAAAYITIRGAVVVLQETLLAFFTKTEQGIEILERKLNGFKASVSVLQGEFVKLGKAMIGEKGNESTPWGDRIVKGLRLISTTANLIPGVSKYFDDLAKRMNEAGVAAENYTRINQDLEDAERGLIVPRAEANLKIREARLLYEDSTKSVRERIKALEDAIRMENEMADTEMKHQQFVILNLRDINEEKKKTGMLRDEDLLELENAIAREIDLRSESAARQVRQTANLTAARKELMKEDQYNTVEYYLHLRDSFFDYIDEINKEKEFQWEFDLQLGKLQFKQNQDQAKKEWDERLENEEKEKKSGEDLVKYKKEALEKMGEYVLDYLFILENLTQREVERAQREREILDTRVSETQSALETEVELYKAGYASNVTAKQEEVTKIKAARDKALAEEEKARKRQHQIELASLVAQKAVDVAKIISTTAVANAKAVALSPLTLGQPWVGLNTIAAALGIAAATAAIVAASTAKYAKGGWTGEGSHRDETGERMAGVVHEKEFVVRKGPASRFREVLEAINKDDKLAVYNSFNRLSPDLMGGTQVSNITVENNGPNNRLDRINNQLYQLNRVLSPKRQSSKTEIFQSGSSVIIRKGNSTKVINK